MDRDLVKEESAQNGHMEPSCGFLTFEMKDSRHVMDSLRWIRHLQWKLALRMRNVSSPAGKEPELVCEMENFGLDIVGFTSSHRMSSSTKLLDQRWSLSHSRVPTGVSPQVGVGILTSLRLRDFFPLRGKEEVSGRKSLTVGYICTKQQFRVFSQWSSL